MAQEENTPETLVQEATEQVSSGRRAAIKNLKGLGAKTGPYIKNNPYLSLGVAAVTGYVVSRLISSRK